MEVQLQVTVLPDWLQVPLFVAEEESNADVALVSVSFRVPLARTPPVFEIDWDGDHKVDSIGPFRSGGAGFPNTERCE